MRDELTEPDALRFAAMLKAIPDCPWDEAVTQIHAGFLKDWCHGAIVDNGLWPAAAQAEWLVSVAILRWTDTDINPSGKWLGAGALRKLFREKFEKPKSEDER